MPGCRLVSRPSRSFRCGRRSGRAHSPSPLDGREVIAVFEDLQAAKPSYLMWLEWRDGLISFIRDYKYVRYVIDDAELVLAPVAALPGEATAD